MTRVPKNPNVLEGTSRLKQAAWRQTYHTQRLKWTLLCRLRGGGGKSSARFQSKEESVGGSLSFWIQVKRNVPLWHFLLSKLNFTF